jgi:hypothetical protein
MLTNHMQLRAQLIQFSDHPLKFLKLLAMPDLKLLPSLLLMAMTFPQRIDLFIDTISTEFRNLFNLGGNENNAEYNNITNIS